MQAEVTMLQSAFCLRHTGTPITAKLRYWLTWMATMICKDKNGVAKFPLIFHNFFHIINMNGYEGI